MATPLNQYQASRARILKSRSPASRTPRLPSAVERSYVALLGRFSRRVQTIVLSSTGLTRTRVDADWDPNLRDQIDRLADSLSPELLAIFRKLDQHSRLEMTRVMQLDLRADPRLALQSRKFVRENLDLIKSAAGEQLDKMRAIVSAGVEQGLSGAALKRQLVERAGVLDSRAELIARDQTLKANADLNRYRQEALGVRKYTWSTSQDERVRKDHAALNGRVFSYDDPPVVDQKTGRRDNPGRDFQCRCVAIPVTEDLLFGEGEG